jgi:predicted nucleic acid-binding protein
VDQQTDSQAWTETLKITDLFQLTVYDAEYLELARRRNLPLATLESSAPATAFAVKLVDS